MPVAHRKHNDGSGSFGCVATRPERCAFPMEVKSATNFQGDLPVMDLYWIFVKRWPCPGPAPGAAVYFREASASAVVDGP